MDQIALKRRSTMSKKGKIDENAEKKNEVEPLNPNNYEANFIILNVSKDIRFKQGMRILTFC